ncbi:hypothetical protein [Neomoorella mulderi]|uniref:Uncharacterized protein n=1 Tax=Moorella mulderi DSM 14980 TaxID=1122241 RepID=A0A151AUF3_9FIRM|nr:hypothetical protein [Moorella mulderi]KYH31231.1 hypothetical protein MOMUL_24610 [Moorella mulderi DSM 14980]
MANPNNKASKLLQYVKNSLNLSDNEANKLEKRLWLFASCIRQPRKDDRSCNKTPFFNRWDINNQTSYLTPEDPRYATEEECQRVYETLLAMLLEAYGISIPPDSDIKIVEETLGRSFKPHSLICVHTGKMISGDDIKRALSYTTQRLGNYEIPTSYRVELNAGGRHEHTNVGWMKPLHIIYTLRNILRSHLRRAGVPSNAIKNALDKIQVKAYCTDKVTMPPYFSNRDVRWATWPSSNQYASHYECAMIELELLAELYEFAGAPLLPDKIKSQIIEARRRTFLSHPRRCFVTGRVLNFIDYVQAAINTQGGRSAYHVGHITPLTRGGRHTWENIAWQSDDGNRIQGNDTVQEIEVKLVDAVMYHLRRDMEKEKPSREFYEKVEMLWSLLNDIREYQGKPRFQW